MKNVYLILLGVLQFAVVHAQQLSDLSFLEGSWQASTSDGVFFENWTVHEDGSLSGLGLLIENGDTISQEKLRITEAAGSIVYIASPDGIPPVMFTLQPDSAGIYRFTNPAHDFPQVISYQVLGENRMHVEVGSLEGEGFMLEMERKHTDSTSEHEGALFKSDAVVFGILMLILGFVFYTSSSSSRFWQKFYSVVPALLLCYFIPGILNSLNIIDGENSGIYRLTSRYLLPASLLLLCIGIDFKGILKLGPKALIMFLAGTLGVMLGGPVALWIAGMFNPGLLADAGENSVWRGLSTIAGSWIGGGANQAAMKEVFKPGSDLFSIMVAVDVLVANVWMAILLLGAGNTAKVDRWLRADTRAIDDLKDRMIAIEKSTARIPRLPDTMVILAFAFCGTGISHLLADHLSPWLAENAPVLERFSLTSTFFWIVVIATTIGLLLSFTNARRYEGAGASRLGSAFLYVLVASIGMNMDITAVVSRPGLFLVGFIWISIHALIMIGVAKLIKAPLFYLAVGSQANVGGAASAPVVASAFHPTLAPVGVLLAVLGYALGTYGAWLSGILMQMISD